MTPYRNGILVIGAGGIGQAVARRLGVGRNVFLADFSQKSLDLASKSLQNEGHVIQTQLVDVSDYESVKSLAKAASSSIRLDTVVNTAGISPSMGTARKVYEVDLLGTANVIDAFLKAMPTGSSLISLASIAGHLGQSQISAELETHLAKSPKEELLHHREIDLEGSPGMAYCIAKWGNIVRAQASIRESQRRGIRINTVSPGITMTPMIQEELQSEAGDNIKKMIEETPALRAASTDEIANVVAFLASPSADFINGADFVIDGGATAASKFDHPISEVA